MLTLHLLKYFTGFREGKKKTMTGYTAFSFKQTNMKDIRYKAVIFVFLSSRYLKDTWHKPPIVELCRIIMP